MSAIQKLKLILSYDGTDYCGWQKQLPHAHAPELPSVQETVEKSLQSILGHPVHLMGSGRTDAGVHAINQVAHFETTKPLPKDLCWALKAKLPPSIVAKRAFIAPEEFHATLSAERKTYRYWVWNASRPTALLVRYSHWVRRELDLGRLNEMSQILVGKHDFASFRSVGTPVQHTVREIYSAQWKIRGKHLLEFEVTGSGFLKQMVRAIVGTQLDLMLKNRPCTDLALILGAKDRSKAGPTAPPQGLFLYRVYYPKNLDKKCRQI